MSVAELYPAQRQADGRMWWRPVRPAGTDFSQWGWTSDPLQAHPDYLAQHDAQTGGLHPEWMCGRDCSGCVSEGEGGGTCPRRPAVRELGDPAALSDAAAFGVAYVAVQPPAVAVLVERPEDHLPLSRTWVCDEEGRTLSGASVCGTCDGGGCFDCCE